ncbi:phosphatase PAP2 family protein [Dyadobacter sandarakinus]|uniref:Phosphatase PAP2 family protein n=1 Tax=Dyadobacter sandarakinus TaxID=2747268 RepID=A0ABX7I251_9BACT|nr:phosphatase PAP2 family protein [Dyadobacter sandarakinus]QRQ99962.1 phosphatase PAP2 family protein [Dyadobacter sandarakinus]
MTGLVEDIIRGDQDLFLWLNGQHTPWVDSLMYWITFKYTWIPLYLLLITITFMKENRRGFGIMLTVLAAVIIADQITSGFMKPYFIRFRPCHDPALRSMVHTVAGCGGLYGFASSHASTSFAVASSWFFLLRKRVPYLWLLFVWAGFYSYSRIYVGVHYPADVLIGALIGMLAGGCCSALYATFLSKYTRN